MFACLWGFDECVGRVSDLEPTEFDFRVVGDGRSAVARYANNSNYRNDSLIRKESASYSFSTSSSSSFSGYAHDAQSLLS